MQATHSLRIALLLALVAAWCGTPQAGWENGNWASVMDPQGNGEAVVAVSDGAGGAIVATLDQGSNIKVAYNRLDHAGNKLWGPAGRVIPFDLGSTSQEGPVGMVSDGVGGAFISYREVWGPHHYLRVARVLADGSVDWVNFTGDYGYSGGSMAFVATLVAGVNDDVFAVWLRDFPTQPNKDEALQVARVDGTGSVLWTVEANQEAELYQNPTPSYLRAIGDGAGGVLAAWTVQPTARPMQLRIQRVNPQGALHWGANGQQIMAGFSGAPMLANDGGTGVFVGLAAGAGLGDTHVQHVNNNGNELWGPQGILAQSAPTSYAAARAMCADASGGVYVATGNEDLYVQRVDAFGTPLWGAAGVKVTTEAGWQMKPSLCADPWGGVIVGYENFYTASVQDPQNSHLGAARIDIFGTVLWHNSGIWQGGWEDGLQPLDPQLVADGSGGAILVWHESNYTGSDDDVRALGFTSAGAAPWPVLSYLGPDAVEPGDVGVGLVLGDYLEPTHQFVIKNRSTGQEVALSSPVVSNGILVTAQYDFTGAPEGAYDLLVRDGATTLASLEHALGVGPRPPCDQDEPVPGVGPSPVQLPLGLRAVAYDDGGVLHASWVESDGGLWNLMHSPVAGGGWGPTDQVSMGEPILSLAATVDGSGELHRALTSTNGSDFSITTHSFDTSLVTDTFPYRVADPTMATDANGVAHLIHLEENPAGHRLVHRQFDGFSFPGGTDILAGVNPRSPDLIRAGDDLVVIYVRDTWLPGVAEVCFQTFDGLNWGAPVPMYFGFEITSPSAAWDGVDRVLFAWVLDNTGGTSPLLHTLTMDGGVLGPVRPRVGDPVPSRTAVAGIAEKRFALLTQESDGNLPTKVYVRTGDGDVFFPRRRVNTEGDVDFPAFAAHRGSGDMFAMWHGFEDPGQPMSYYSCDLLIETAIEATPVLTASPMVAAPNPFNPSTVLRFSLAAPGRPEVSIYDPRGRRVRILRPGDLGAGMHRIDFDGRDDRGHSLASGVYYARLVAGPQDERIKLVLLK